MPSVKSYQNRKAEIERLLKFLVEKDREIFRLSTENKRLINTIFDYLTLQITPAFVLPANKDEVNALKKEIEALKLTNRLYREYILKNYNPDVADILEIPACLKPLDSIEYIGEIRGFNS